MATHLASRATSWPLGVTVSSWQQPVAGQTSGLHSQFVGRQPLHTGQSTLLALRGVRKTKRSQRPQLQTGAVARASLAEAVGTEVELPEVAQAPEGAQALGQLLGESSDALQEPVALTADTVGVGLPVSQDAPVTSADNAITAFLEKLEKPTGTPAETPLPAAPDFQPPDVSGTLEKASLDSTEGIPIPALPSASAGEPSSAGESSGVQQGLKDLFSAAKKSFTGPAQPPQDVPPGTNEGVESILTGPSSDNIAGMPALGLPSSTAGEPSLAREPSGVQQGFKDLFSAAKKSFTEPAQPPQDLPSGTNEAAESILTVPSPDSTAGIPAPVSPSATGGEPSSAGEPSGVQQGLKDLFSAAKKSFTEPAEPPQDLPSGTNEAVESILTGPSSDNTAGIPAPALSSATAGEPSAAGEPSGVQQGLKDLFSAAKKSFTEPAQPPLDAPFEKNDIVQSTLRAAEKSTPTGVQGQEQLPDIKGTLDALQGGIGGANEAVTKSVSGLVDSAGNAVDSASQSISGAISGVQNSVSGAVGSTQAAFRDALAALERSYQELIKGAQGSVDGALQTVKGTVDGAVQTVKGSVDGAVEGVKGSVDGTVQATGSSLSTFQNQLGEQAGTLLAPLRKVGEPIQQAFDGVSSVVGERAAEVSKAVESALPPEVQAQLRTASEKASELGGPLKDALGQAGGVALRIAKSVGFDPTDPIYGTVLVGGSTVTVGVWWWLQQRAGYEGDLTAEETYELLREERNVALVDVRPQSVRDKQGLPDLRRGLRYKYANVEPQKLEKSVRSIVEDGALTERLVLAAKIINLKNVGRGTKVVVMDESGSEAKDIARAVSTLGVRRAYRLQGGYAEWEKAGLRVKSEAPAVRLAIVKEDAEAIVEETGLPISVLVSSIVGGTTAGAYAIYEWEKTLQLIAVLGIGSTIYSRVNSYESVEDFKSDLRLVLKPFALLTQAVMGGSGQIDNILSGRKPATSPSSPADTTEAPAVEDAPSEDEEYDDPVVFDEEPRPAAKEPSPAQAPPAAPALVMQESSNGATPAPNNGA